MQELPTFDDIILKLRENQPFDELYNKAYEKLLYMTQHCHSIKQAGIISEILDLSNISIEYLCKLPMKKLYKVAKQYKIGWNYE